jgi:cytochrome P450
MAVALQDLHEKYGPIIRMGPDEVHVNDPAFYNEMYTPNARRRDKSRLWFWMVDSGQFGDGSTFMTMSHELHRLRRSGLNPFFSKRMVRELEPRVVKEVERLRERVLELSGKNDVLDVYNAMSGLTLGEYPSPSDQRES